VGAVGTAVSSGGVITRGGRLGGGGGVPSWGGGWGGGAGSSAGGGAAGLSGRAGAGAAVAAAWADAGKPETASSIASHPARSKPNPLRSGPTWRLLNLSGTWALGA